MIGFGRRVRPGLFGTLVTALPAERAEKSRAPSVKFSRRVSYGLFRFFCATFDRICRCQTRLANCAFFVLVLFGIFNVSPLNAEWGSDDRQLLRKIGGDLEQSIKPNLEGVKTSSNLIYELLKKDLPQLNNVVSGISEIQRQLGVQGGTVSISETLLDIRDTLGFGLGASVNQNLSSVLSKLEALRTSLGSSGSMTYFTVNSSGSFVENHTYGSDLSGFDQRIIYQVRELGNFLKYWNGHYFSQVTSKLDDLLSKMDESSGGSSDLSKIEEYLESLNGYFGGNGSLDFSRDIIGVAGSVPLGSVSFDLIGIKRECVS